MAFKKIIYYKIWLGLTFKFILKTVKPKIGLKLVFNSRNPVCKKQPVFTPPLLVQWYHWTLRHHNYADNALWGSGQCYWTAYVKHPRSSLQRTTWPCHRTGYNHSYLTYDARNATSRQKCRFNAHTQTVWSQHTANIIHHQCFKSLQRATLQSDHKPDTHNATCILLTDIIPGCCIDESIQIMLGLLDYNRDWWK